MFSHSQSEAAACLVWQLNHKIKGAVRWLTEQESKIFTQIFSVKFSQNFQAFFLYLKGITAQKTTKTWIISSWPIDTGKNRSHVRFNISNCPPWTPWWVFIKWLRCRYSGYMCAPWSYTAGILVADVIIQSRQSKSKEVKLRLSHLIFLSVMYHHDRHYNRLKKMWNFAWLHINLLYWY